MQVFVVGGTGAVGRHAVPALVAAGHGVTALARSPDKARDLHDQGATAESASIFDPVGLSSVFSGHDAVVNVATAIPPMTRFMSRRAWRDNQRIRTEGSAAIVEAARTA